MRFFTSDFHLGSTNIIKYANRPFASAEEMVNVLVDNCNKTASLKSDTIIHVGDFLLTGSDGHDKTLGRDESSLMCSQRELTLMFNANLVLLAGNHDDSHNANTIAKSMVIDLNQNYRNVYVSHYPSDHPSYHGPDCSRWRKGIGITLCGHVHSKWLLKYDQKKNVLNVNVGCDVWNYRPVRDAEITELLDFMKTINVYDFSWKWDRATYDMYVDARKRELELGRVARKNERYAKKGLTPEECQRRKEAAMRAKGLIK